MDEQKPVDAKSEQRLALATLGVDIVLLTKNMDEFIRNKVNFHYLYTQKMIATAKQKVESKRQAENR